MVKAKTYRFGFNNESVIEFDPETGIERTIPYTTDRSNVMIAGNVDYQNVIKLLDEGSIVIEAYEAPKSVEPDINSVDKIWFVRALRQLNLKEGFDKALGAMDEELQEDFSLMVVISKTDPVVAAWVKSAKVKASKLLEVFTTADSLKKANG
ncbi:hypothetical protein phiOC_p165 [Ochrobactrum phage vB_OspM_OC]|nr:hypothetical protein phiOC_p165 [Ochrobactrum phage vB_OspM_OC]